MELYIETLTGAAFELRVSPFETVLSVKSKLQRLEGIPVSQQHLIFQDEELEDDYCLHDYNIQDGATLKLVLAMRGGPINTRRVVMEDPALLEMAEYLETNQDEILDVLPSGNNNRQVTLLVYREGDQLNFFRVVDQGDGALSPQSESLSGNSVYNLYDDEEEEEGAAGSESHVQENMRMKEKMKLLRSRMKNLTLTRKPKRKVPHPPSGGSSRPKSSRVRARVLSAGRTRHQAGATQPLLPGGGGPHTRPYPAHPAPHPPTVAPPGGSFLPEIPGGKATQPIQPQPSYAKTPRQGPTLGYPLQAKSTASKGPHLAGTPTHYTIQTKLSQQGGGGTHPTPGAYSLKSPLQRRSTGNLSLEAKGSTAPQSVQSHSRLINAELSGSKIRTSSGAITDNNNTTKCSNNNYLPSNNQSTTDVSRSVLKTVQQNSAQTKNHDNVMGSKSRPSSGGAGLLSRSKKSSLTFVALEKGFPAGPGVESEVSLSPEAAPLSSGATSESPGAAPPSPGEAASVSPGAMSHTPLISAPGHSPRSSVLSRPKSSASKTQEDLEAMLNAQIPSPSDDPPHHGDAVTDDVFLSDNNPGMVAKEVVTSPVTRHMTSSSARKRKDAAAVSLVTVKENQPLGTNQNYPTASNNHHHNHPSNKPVHASIATDKKSTKSATTPGRTTSPFVRKDSNQPIPRPPSSSSLSRHKQNGVASGAGGASGGILLESLTSQEARGLLHQTSLERLGSSRIGNYVRRSATKSRGGFMLNGDRIYSPDGSRLPQSSARFRRAAAGSPRLPPVKHRKKSKRCCICAKKTGLATSYQCRCGNNYCASHRYAEAHGCTFDYKNEGRKLLEQNNPVVTAPKLPKI